MSATFPAMENSSTSYQVKMIVELNVSMAESMYHHSLPKIDPRIVFFLGLKDPYPDGDPRGPQYDPKVLIPKLRSETAINFYVFLRLTKYTDKMIAHFKAYAAQPGLLSS